MTGRTGLRVSRSRGRHGASQCFGLDRGTFYDRFALANTLSALRYNGTVQQQLVIPNPDFFFNVPPGLSAGVPGVIEKVSDNLRTPSLMQTLVSFERELPLKSTMSITYANSRGTHMLRSRNINAPLPESGLYPYGETAGPAVSNGGVGSVRPESNDLTLNTRATEKISLSGTYALNRANSNTDGINTFPANQYNLNGEYGPAALDIRHRGTIAGTIDTWWGLRLNPLLNVLSGPPFNITTGDEYYGSAVLTARPGIAPAGSTKPGLIATPYGMLDPNPNRGEPVLPRNYGRGPGSICSIKGDKDDQAATALIARRCDADSQSAESQQSGTHYRHDHLATVCSANRSAGSRDLGGGGFSESANNRRLELQVRYTF